MIYSKETGWWLPDGEEHLQAWMLKVGKTHHERLTYQRHKYLKALEWVKDRRTALDIGAHVGLWSWQMTFDFAIVEAFEPMPAHGDCWKLNLKGRENTVFYPFALGNREARVRLETRTKGSSGDTGIVPDELDPVSDELGPVVDMFPLDTFNFGPVDFIKIDCEGFEVFVLRGARETLLKHKPCVIVEQKPETGGAQRYGTGVTDAVEFLLGLGAKKRAGIQGDYIMSWD